MEKDNMSKGFTLAELSIFLLLILLAVLSWFYAVKEVNKKPKIDDCRCCVNNTYYIKVPIH